MGSKLQKKCSNLQIFEQQSFRFFSVTIPVQGCEVIYILTLHPCTGIVTRLKIVGFVHFLGDVSPEPSRHAIRLPQEYPIVVRDATYISLTSSHRYLFSSSTSRNTVVEDSSLAGFPCDISLRISLALAIASCCKGRRRI